MNFDDNLHFFLYDHDLLLTFTDFSTLFYQYPRPGNKAMFQSVEYSRSAEFLVMNGDGTLSLSKLSKDTVYEFSKVRVEKSSRFFHLFATVPSGDTCYISFDPSGSPLANQCNSLSAVGSENAKVQIPIAS
jgi:hypothetical protein